MLLKPRKPKKMRERVYSQGKRTKQLCKPPNARKQDNGNTKPCIILGVVFLGSVVALGIAYWNFPELEE